ncbi:MAG: Ig-like domain-containing protein [Candidatus Moraniibacteriota bacterium]
MIQKIFHPIIVLAGLSLSVFVLAALVLFALCGTAHAWTETLDFESGTLGAGCRTASDGWNSGTWAQSTLSNTHTISGNKSCKHHYIAGDEGFNVTGGERDVSSIGSGGEIWMRGYWYLNAGWSWDRQDTGQAAIIKVMRAASSGGGFLSVLADGDGCILSSNEPQDRQTCTGIHFTIGAWQSIEMYVKWGGAGAGRTRLWKDGILIYNGSLENTGGSFNGTTYIWSNWNGGPANTQDSWTDGIVYTTDTPSNVDASGNPMIGPIGWGGGGDTTAPTGVAVTVPSNGATVSGNQTVTAICSDNVAVANVQMLLDGSNLGAADTSSPYSITWNTTGTSNGSHTLSARCTDTSSNQTTSSTISVTVSNTDTTAPAAPTGLGVQ